MMALHRRDSGWHSGWLVIGALALGVRVPGAAWVWCSGYLAMGPAGPSAGTCCLGPGAALVPSGYPNYILP
jgi:hypothetical protein